MKRSSDTTPPQLSIQYAPTFIRMYRRLHQDLREEIKRKIVLFQNTTNHKQLKVHKLKGLLENTYSFSVNYKIRIVFEYDTRNTVNLLYVGNHDTTYD